MANRLDIVNGALRFLGKAPVQSLLHTDSESELAKSLDYAIDSAVSILLLKYDWIFSIRLHEFTTPTSTNYSSEYRYTYRLPYDFGRIHRFFCGCCVDYPCCFEIINDIIMTNQCPVKFYYIVNRIKDFTIVPEYFARLVSYFIAQDVSLAYTKNLNEQQYLIARYDRELNLAINANNVNRPFVKRGHCDWGGYGGCCG